GYDEMQSRIVEHPLQMGFAAGSEVVVYDNLIVRAPQQCVSEVATDESGTTRDKRARHASNGTAPDSSRATALSEASGAPSPRIAPCRSSRDPRRVTRTGAEHSVVHLAAAADLDGGWSRSGSTQRHAAC